MFKIGEFSKMSGLSIDTLYHYQQIGILKPSVVNRDTKYRYYEAVQLVTVNKILALKDAGFSLTEISTIIKSKNNISLIDMLEDKLENLENFLLEEENRLSRLKKNIFLIKNGGIPQMNEISIKRVEEILVASIRKSFPKNEIDEQFEALWTNVNDYINKMNVKRSIPCMMLYHNNTWTFEKPELDVEVVEPITKELSESEQVSVYKMPAVEKMACIVQKGPFDTMWKSYHAISEWITKNNYTINGPIREIYHKGDWATDDTNEYITELQFPIN